MNVYVESNFVLELALLQEQSTSCEEILGLGETSGVQLVVPAYSLAEPYETLTRRQRQRKRLKEELDAELRQIARTATYAERLDGFRDVTALLMNIGDEESKRLEEVCSRLTKAAEVIPLDASVLSASTQYQRIHGFAPQDALVYSTVLSHLEQARATRSCFLNRNSRDFDDQTVVEQLERYNCKLLPRFDSGSHFILNALR
ncbi:MAG: hypothetical protein OXI15_19595 [Chromatiales bacterium]|nr:hypothetical protein [Chromatiales bacterium]